MIMTTERPRETVSPDNGGALRHTLMHTHAHTQRRAAGCSMGVR